MKNKILSFLIIFFCTLIISSCHKDSPTDTNVVDKLSIVPIKVGNSWSYSGTSYDTLGSIIETFGERMDVSKDSLISNVRYFLYNGFLSVDTDTGLVSIVGQSKKYYYKYPVVIGEKYHSLFHDCYISSVDTVIQVSVGAFHCVRYEKFNGSIRIGVDFVSPGMGMIKHIGYYSFLSGKDDQRVFDSTALSSFLLK